MNGSKTYTAEETVFNDLSGRNVGFKNWHPTPVTPNGDTLAGQADMGGLWEWTSTPLMPHEGFNPMDIYPGYTCELYWWARNNNLPLIIPQKPTFLMGSTMSSSGARGLHFLELLVGRLCEYNAINLRPVNLTISSVNWYQHNYPYAWVGARLVRDV